MYIKLKLKWNENRFNFSYDMWKWYNGGAGVACELRVQSVSICVYMLRWQTVSQRADRRRRRGRR